MDLLQILIGITAVFLSIIIYFQYKFTFWSRHKVPYIRPSFPFGNFKEFFFGQKNVATISYELHKKIKAKGLKYSGVYFLQKPIFVPTDPIIIKHILSTDFDHFSERGMFYNDKIDPLASHLFALPTKEWKQLRNKMTPSFSSGKVKMLFELMKKAGNELVDVITDMQDKLIPINDFAVRYTVDIIGTCAFGIECNSLKNPDEEFRQIAEKVINPPRANGLKWFISLMGPDLRYLIRSSINEPDITNFFTNIVNQTMKYRETNNVRRNDFFQSLLDLKEKEAKSNDNSGMKMTFNLIASQCFVFFAAGFETTSMTVNLCLYEMTQNQDIQDKVRNEIRRVLKEHNGELTYEAIKDMTYLDCIVQETLRKYPSLAFLNRVCIKDYKVPDTDVTITKGTKVLVSLWGFQMDPDYFPDPERFDPDRFNNANKEKIQPFTHLPFGDGHRVCIGARFGLLQTKVCLASVLGNFKLTLDPKTITPIDYQAFSFVLSLKNPIYLRAEKV